MAGERILTTLLAPYLLTYGVPEESKDYEESKVCYFRYPKHRSFLTEHRDGFNLVFGLQGAGQGLRIRRDNKMVPLEPYTMSILVGRPTSEASEGHIPVASHDAISQGTDREAVVFGYSPNMWKFYAQLAKKVRAGETPSPVPAGIGH